MRPIWPPVKVVVPSADWKNHAQLYPQESPGAQADAEPSKVTRSPTCGVDVLMTNDVGGGGGGGGAVVVVVVAGGGAADDDEDEDEDDEEGAAGSVVDDVSAAVGVVVVAAVDGGTPVVVVVTAAGPVVVVAPEVSGAPDVDVVPPVRGDVVVSADPAVVSFTDDELGASGSVEAGSVDETSVVGSTASAASSTSAESSTSAALASGAALDCVVVSSSFGGQRSATQALDAERGPCPPLAAAADAKASNAPTTDPMITRFFMMRVALSPVLPSTRAILRPRPVTILEEPDW